MTISPLLQLAIISNGLILEFIGKIIKSSSDPLFFKKTYEILNNIDEKDIQILKDEILNLKVSTNEKYNQNKDIIYNIKSSKAEIDYDYYKKFNAVRLNFNQKDLLSSKVISEFIIKSNFSKIIDKIILKETPPMLFLFFLGIFLFYFFLLKWDEMRAAIYNSSSQ